VDIGGKLKKGKLVFSWEQTDLKRRRNQIYLKVATKGSVVKRRKGRGGGRGNHDLEIENWRTGMKIGVQDAEQTSKWHCRKGGKRSKRPKDSATQTQK